MYPPFLATIAILATLDIASAQNYALSDSYSASNFFDKFDFFTDNDPSGGWVTYVDRPTAENKSYTVIGGSVVYIGVDTTTVLDPAGPGREAVRLNSKIQYQYGLFIADISHAPGGICSIWPSWWFVGPNWPMNGEFDILEGVNSYESNIMSAHTTANCTISTANQLGTVLSNDCNSGFSTDDPTNGCSTQSASNSSFGNPFNAIGGGVYSMLWTSDGISVWFFPRGNIPADINSQTPDPTTWGEPDGRVAQADCAIDAHFSNMTMVLDTDFCGGWASGLWESSGCNTRADTCVNYVANNPSAFGNAFWAINYINVYQLQTSTDPGSGDSTDTTQMPSPTSVPASTYTEDEIAPADPNKGQKVVGGEKTMDHVDL